MKKKNISRLFFGTLIFVWTFLLALLCIPNNYEKEYKDAVAQTDRLNSQYSATIQNKSNEITKLQNKVTTLTNEKITLENTLTSVNSELNTTKTKLANKETELTNTQNRLDTVSATLTEKESLLAQSQIELENAIANGELQAEEIAQQKLDITNLQSDINVLNSEKTTLQNKVTTLTNEKQVLITERDNLQNQVDDLTFRNTSLETDLANYTHMLEQAESDLATKTAELEQANARIEELENSGLQNTEYKFEKRLDWFSISINGTQVKGGATASVEISVENVILPVMGYEVDSYEVFESNIVCVLDSSNDEELTAFIQNKNYSAGGAVSYIKFVDENGNELTLFDVSNYETFTAYICEYGLSYHENAECYKINATIQLTNGVLKSGGETDFPGWPWGDEE